MLGDLSLEMDGEDDLGFFLSDPIGELELDPKDRGLLEDPSGLEVSDFLEEKNLPLNTILIALYPCPPSLFWDPEHSFTDQSSKIKIAATEFVLVTVA